MCEPAFPFPLLQQFTSHSHVRHGICSHHILHTASLELLKIKNVANHKYLKSPGAGICTVFKQTFLIWYLFFFYNSNAPLARFFFSPLSLLCQQKVSRCSGTAATEHHKSHCPAVQTGGETAASPDPLTSSFCFSSWLDFVQVCGDLMA